MSAEFGGIFVLVVSALISGLFVASGFAKFAEGAEFTAAVHTFVLPRWLERVASRAVPPMELAIALSMVVGLGSPWPTLMAFSVLVGFAIVLIGARLAGLEVKCGCFGASRQHVPSAAAIARNLLLAGLALVSGLIQLSAGSQHISLWPLLLPAAAVAALGHYQVSRFLEMKEVAAT